MIFFDIFSVNLYLYYFRLTKQLKPSCTKVRRTMCKRRYEHLLLYINAYLGAKHVTIHFYSEDDICRMLFKLLQ